jgi:hypothetical protein
MPLADEDVLRDLMHRCTDDLHPRPSIATTVVSRQRRRDRRTRVVSVTATGAALGTAAAVAVVAGSRHAPDAAQPARPAIALTAAQQALNKLSVTAASQPQGQGRYVVLREVQDTYARTSVIDGVSGDVWTYQKGAGVPAELPVDRHGSMTQAQFDAVPTAAAALRTFLIAQYDQQQKQAEVALARQVAKTEKQVHAHKPGILASMRPVKLSTDGKVFEQAYLMLWNPLPRPALRAALFRVLAAIPGVRVSQHAHDSLGRPAVKISWFDPANKVTSATFEDPSTTRVLEQTDFIPAQSGTGRATSGRDLYLSVTRASSLPPNPYR